MKELIYKHCITHVEERLQRIQHTIARLQESLTSETKSTAGDKHETGRAMVQLEREKAGIQLAEIQKLQQLLAKISLNANTAVVHLGSLVRTTRAVYFIAISIGEVKIADEVVFAIAPNTPIGKLLLGKKRGESITFNDSTQRILEIF